ncbi:hypothetical protein WR25_10503 [Diploscapter pachys]|uniref:pantothenate kinase n=1 Tax=Diploscapter pachys TaxID=2018661 RepID=A0A2A2JYM7_9BILA|nr:hypothetical protein WR25_10503 [Diploscapter pachys]
MRVPLLPTPKSRREGVKKKDEWVRPPSNVEFSRSDEGRVTYQVEPNGPVFETWRNPTKLDRLKSLKFVSKNSKGISKENDHSVSTRKWSFLSNYGYSEDTQKGRLDHLVEGGKVKVETVHEKKIPSLLDNISLESMSPEHEDFNEKEENEDSERSGSSGSYEVGSEESCRKSPGKISEPELSPEDTIQLCKYMVAKGQQHASLVADDELPFYITQLIDLNDQLGNLIEKNERKKDDLKSVLKEEVDQIKKVHANLPPFLEQAIQIKDDYVTVQNYSTLPFPLPDMSVPPPPLPLQFVPQVSAPHISSPISPMLIQPSPSPSPITLQPSPSSGSSANLSAFLTPVEEMMSAPQASLNVAQSVQRAPILSTSNNNSVQPLAYNSVPAPSLPISTSSLQTPPIQTPPTSEIPTLQKFFYRNENEKSHHYFQAPPPFETECNLPDFQMGYNTKTRRIAYSPPHINRSRKRSSATEKLKKVEQVRRIMDELLLASHLKRIDSSGRVRIATSPVVREKPACPFVVVPPDEPRFEALFTKQRYSVDIGGTLCKVVYSTISRINENSDEKPMVLLNFRKFTSIDACIQFLKETWIHRESTDVLHCTGGGSFKYSDRLELELGVKVKKTDEMNSLIYGCDFLLRHNEDESFTYHHEATGIDKFQYRPINPDTIFPFLLVNIGTGISVLKVDSPTTFQRVGGSSMGGGAFIGLGSLLTSAKDFDGLLQLAERGDHRQIDTLVSDIYGGSYSNLNLAADLIAGSFGKCSRQQLDGKTGPKEEDIAKSLLLMISNSIGQMAMLYGNRYQMKRIYFGGFFIRRNPITMRTLTYAINFWSQGAMDALFMKHEGYLGAVGAFMDESEA